MKKFTEEEMDRLLFDELKQQPEINLSPDFSQKIITRLSAQKNNPAGGATHYRLWIFVIVGLTAGLVGLLFLWREALTPLLNGVVKYKWPLLFSSCFLFLFQYIDHRRLLISAHRL